MIIVVVVRFLNIALILFLCDFLRVCIYAFLMKKFLDFTQLILLRKNSLKFKFETNVYISLYIYLHVSIFARFTMFTMGYWASALWFLDVSLNVKSILYANILVICSQYYLYAIYQNLIF